MNDINDVINKILKFRNERDWKKFHTPENLAKSIAIESGELLEAFQWGDAYSQEELEEELADILIYALLLSDAINVNPLKIIEKKLKLNEERFPVHKVYGTSGKTTKEKLKND